VGGVVHTQYARSVVRRVFGESVRIRCECTGYRPDILYNISADDIGGHAIKRTIFGKDSTPNLIRYHRSSKPTRYRIIVAR
jgi:hypothetical protein